MGGRKRHRIAIFYNDLILQNILALCEFGQGLAWVGKTARIGRR